MLSETNQRTIRPATPADIPAIMQVMEAAKGIMRASGNMLQWQGNYPSEEVLRSDMEREGGFVIMDNDRTVGYFAFLPSPDPTYAKIYQGQ